jgi:hypothetical protein
MHFTNNEKPRNLVDRIISFDGDTYKVINVGFIENGSVYCHLASTTRGRAQRNGWIAAQHCGWIPLEMFK